MRPSSSFLFIALIIGMVWSCQQDDLGDGDDLVDDGFVDTIFTGFSGVVDGVDFRWTLENPIFELIDSQSITLRDLPDTSRSRYYAAVVDEEEIRYIELSNGDVGFIASKSPSGDDFFAFYDRIIPRFVYEGYVYDTLYDTLGNISYIDTAFWRGPGYVMRFQNRIGQQWTSLYVRQPPSSFLEFTEFDEVLTVEGIEYIDFEAKFDVTLTDTETRTRLLRIQSGQMRGAFRNE